MGTGVIKFWESAECRGEKTGPHTDRGFDHCPECQPRAAGRAVAPGLDSNLDDADDGPDYADDADTEDASNAPFLSAWDLEVPYHPEWEDHDCEGFC